jgi:HEAT repeat protein
MRMTASTLVLAAAVAVASGSAQLPLPVQNTLTAIDVVPTKAQLDQAFPSGEALDGLTTIARDTTSDIGMRLRAIYALAKYCGDPPDTPCAETEVAHQALAELVTEHVEARAGSPVLLLRAAIETLGPLRVQADVTLLLPLLDHASRDIRAATARALRDLCNPQAITPLRVRFDTEPTDQVKLAISDALRILDQCN